MFKLHRHHSKLEKSGERIDFNFSAFRALQVPKGWDRLFVSAYHVKSGKTISKSRKASVRNGNCQWTDTFTETLWISKGLEEWHLKFAVAMGSARSSILGEATVNLVDYTSSKASASVSLPLKKCSHGSVLQVKIQCLTPKVFRAEQGNEKSLCVEDVSVDYDDAGNNSDVSDSAFSRSIRSPSSNHSDGRSHQEEICSRGTSFSASGPRNSFESMEGSFCRESFSSLTGGEMSNQIGRQDSTGSQISLSCSSHSDDPFRSGHSSFKSKLSSESHLQSPKDDSARMLHAITTSALRTTSSSNSHLEAAEATIVELRAEARMWEQNAQKIMHDLETLRGKFSDLSKNKAALELELSTSQNVCDNLRQEIKRLRILLQESVPKEDATDKVKYQTDDLNNICKELESEIKFQKESNLDLAVQLKKTQESNIELVSILQELEHTVESQKVEIDSLQRIKLKYENSERFAGREGNAEANPIKKVLGKEMRKVSCDSNLECCIAENSIKDLGADLELEENWESELKLQKLQESLRILECNNQLLEAAIKDKSREIEVEKGFRAQSLIDCELKWRSQLAAQDQKIDSLEQDLSKALNVINSSDLQFGDTGNNSLNKKLKALEEKVQELERDCDELTNENLELLLKLKELKRDLPTSSVFDNSLSFCSLPLDSTVSYKFGINNPESQISGKPELTTEETSVGKVATCIKSQLMNFENKCTDVELQSQALKEKACYLDFNQELNECCANAEKEEFDSISPQQQKECVVGKKTEKDGQYAVPSAIVGNCELCAATETSKVFLELSEQLELYLSNSQKQLCSLYAAAGIESLHGSDCSENWESVDLTTGKGQAEAILKILVQLNKLFGGKNGLSYSMLKKSDAEMRERKMDSETRHTLLEAQLKESHKQSNKIEALETKFLMLEETASKENFHMPESDAILQEHRQYNEKIVFEENLLNQMYQDKVVEVENLQKEIAHLTEQISATYYEKVIRASDEVLEVPILHAEKAETDDSRNRLEAVQVESESMILKLKGELASSRQDHELLMAEHEKLQVLLQDRDSAKEKLEKAVNELEMKIKASECERLHLEDETFALKIQLQRTASLHEEISALKKSLDESKYENDQLVGSIQFLTQDSANLRDERTSLLQKISSMQKGTSELEECRHKIVTLEEKILRLEGDLTARQALGALEFDLRNEFGEVEKANSQLQSHMKKLVDDKIECLQRVQALEEELKLTSEGQANPVDSRSNPLSNHDDLSAISNPELHAKVSDCQHCSSGNVQVTENNHSSKILCLENELAEALEANELYKSQLKRLLSGSRSGHLDMPRKSTGMDDEMERQVNKQKVPLLEAELKDIRERYFQMSLKYAEVEAQREDLVMKFKAVNKGSRWFS